MKYSPKGNLGLIWKTAYPDRSFDYCLEVLRDGGPSFKTAHVSHAISPTYVPDRGNSMYGDNLSSMDIIGEFPYVVWGDNRSGFEGTWFERVALIAY